MIQYILNSKKNVALSTEKKPIYTSRQRRHFPISHGYSLSTISVFCLPPRGVDAEVLTPPSQNGKRSRQERLYSRRKRGRQEGRREGRIGRTPCGAHLTREMRTSNVKSLEPNGMNMQACPSLSSSAAKTRPCDQERTAEIGRCEQISMREGERERERERERGDCRKRRGFVGCVGGA